MKVKNVNRREFLSRIVKVGAATALGTIVVVNSGCSKFGDSTYTVDGSICDGCGDCLSACNFGAITISKTATIASSKCAGCGKCVSRCSKGAISVS